MRYRKIEFNTVIESKNIHYIGFQDDNLIQEVEAHVNWLLNLSFDDNGLIGIEKELLSVYVEMEKTSLDYAPSTETMVLGDKKGCMKTEYEHVVTEDDFKGRFEWLDVQRVTAVTIDFRFTEIILS